MEADVIVIGSGAGGLSAAVVAARQGLKVVVLEATDTFGGTTAMSGGGVWIVANRHQPELGFADSLDEGRAYLQAVLGNHYNATTIEAFLHHGPRMVEYLEDNTEVLLTASDVPDYAPGQPGWNRGRCLLTASYDAGLLGKSLFAKLRRPIPEFGLFGSMQITPAEAYMMGRWKTSRAFALLAVRLAVTSIDNLPTAVALTRAPYPGEASFGDVLTAEYLDAVCAAAGRDPVIRTGLTILQRRGAPLGK